MVICEDNQCHSNNVLVFFVNGKRVEDANIDPEWTLLYYLRSKLRLCGTKLGCGEGGCGACTVMVSRYDRRQGKVLHLPVNACLAPLCSMHGLAVTTVEGIGSTKTKLHPVQERIAKAHGSQCGFCTPGIVMSMYTLLRNSPKPTMKDMEVAFQGNLCRCTGYRPIIEGYRTFTEEWELKQNASKMSNGVCGMGDKCCKLNGVNGVKDKEDEVLFKTSEFVPYDSTQEPIFPPELKLTDKYDNEYLIFKGQNMTWYRPTTLEELLDLKNTYPEAKLVVGNTEVGVEMKFKHMSYPVIIQPVQIPELIEIRTTTRGVRIGASVTLNEVDEYLRQEIKKRAESETRIFVAMVEMLNWFAGKQIRSVGALGSNIMTGSPISDMIPILMATKARLELKSKANGIRTVVLDDKFFVGYRKSIVKSDEILLSIFVPFTTEHQYFQAYKQARRREDDIAIVNAAINVTFEPKSAIISDISFAFGGMSFKTVTAPKTEAKLKGLPWNRETLEVAYSYLLEDLPLDPGAPGGMIQYRKSLTLSLFFKAFLAISHNLERCVPNIKLDQRELSGIKAFHGQELKSSQYFTVVPGTQEKSDSLQRPIVHMSAYKQACGEAVYCDDIPYQERECLESSDYHNKRKRIDKFNSENRYKKRGLSMVPTKFGISFTAPFLNQGGALVLVYTDGSVLLSHGGIEMGQGLYTKMVQVASRALEIPVEQIHTSETSTDKVPNTSPTAASCGSDLNGMAVLDACNKIKKRLQPYKEKNPKGKWEDWVRMAYFDRVSLAATGFHKTPDIGHNWETGEGNMYNYFTYGVACSEVEIDTLTGDHQVIRTDIVMDLGESLNPAIDIGQIEGGFMQGYGLFVLEELVYSPKGDVFTRGPGTYKLPGFADIPAEFNVSILKGVSNPRAVYSSKAVGEPPLFLACSILFAIKNAIKASREENGIKRSHFRLDAPVTAAKIRMACEDSITTKLAEPQPGTFKPWNVVA